MTQANSEASAARAESRADLKQTRKYMLDLLLLLTAPAVMAWYYYGQRAFKLIAICVITAIITEFAAAALFKSKAYISDLSSIVTAVMIALCLPASSDWSLGVTAVVFATIVAKLPFGDARGMMFSPACTGLAFVTVCFSTQMFAYPAVPVPVTSLVPYSQEGFVSGESLSHMLSQGNSIGLNVVSLIDIAVGNISGPMGATCVLAMAGGLIYLLFRRPKGAVVSVSFILTAALLAFLFPRIGTSRLVSVIMELSGGLMLFGALFFASNELIAPKRFISRVCYGVFGGAVAMLIRLFSPLEEGTVFAILLMNAVTPVFDSKIPVFGLEKKRLLRQLNETEKEEKRLEQQAREIERVQLEQEKAARLSAMIEPKRSKMVEEMSKSIQINTALEIQDIPDEIPEPDTEETEISDGAVDDDIPTLQDISELALKYELDSEENGGGDNE